MAFPLPHLASLRYKYWSWFLTSGFPDTLLNYFSSFALFSFWTFWMLNKWFMIRINRQCHSSFLLFFKMYLYFSASIPQIKGWSIKGWQSLTFPSAWICYLTGLILLFLCLRQMWGGTGIWCGEMSRSCCVHIFSEIGLSSYRSFGSTDLVLYEVGW